MRPNGRPLARALISGALALALSSCSQPTPAASTTVPVPTAASGSQSQVRDAIAYTYQRPDGNRSVDGHGTIPGTQPLDIPLAGEPRWLVAAAWGEASLWVAVLSDGTVEAFQVTGRQALALAIEPARLPVESPVGLLIKGGIPRLLAFPEADGARLTHPVMVAIPEDVLAYVTSSGQLAIQDGSGTERLEANVLPDARVLVDSAGRLLVLTDPTTAYAHGVLGDGIEAGSLTLIDPSPPARISRKIEISPGRVVEGIAPIWADLTGDGRREIIVTISDPQRGAQIVVYSETGELLASGPPIGTGYRWRHQLAVAPFGPGGELELASVRTPHIGGVVEFYRIESDRLEIVAELPGYSSHTIGSRNLDSALAGDFDGDGRLELLVPDQGQLNLAAIRHDRSGVHELWSLPLGSKLATNLAAVSFSDGSLAIGVGTSDRNLRLWLP